MTETRTPGYDPDTDEYTVAGARAALGDIGRSTLYRWLPAESTRRCNIPGMANQIRIKGDVIRRLAAAPGGDEVRD